eukprot:TRINITY_DN862_c0_g1_i2.p1 TRINITY_DN862_c0_g1~~TRINITY_DN862_c0_g1_i2.p1  ORF type:complete len:554 (+),score=185.50 TRINITY_DN862_c0_g1_i2:341-2002(+)
MARVPVAVLAVLAACVASSVAVRLYSDDDDITARSVRVTGLPPGTKPAEVKDFFMQCGDIVSVAMFNPTSDQQFLPPKGSAEVTFKGEYGSACASDMSGKKMGKQTIFVEPSEKRKERNETLEDMKRKEKKDKEERKKKDAEMAKLLGKKDFAMLKAAEMQDKQTKPDLTMGGEEMKKMKKMMAIAGQGRKALDKSMAKMANKIEGQQKKLADMTKKGVASQKSGVAKEVEKSKKATKKLKVEIENNKDMDDAEKQATIDKLNTAEAEIKAGEAKAANGKVDPLSHASQAYLKQLGVLKGLQGTAKNFAKELAPDAYKKNKGDGQAATGDSRTEGFDLAAAKTETGRKTTQPMDPLVYGFGPHYTLRGYAYAMRHLPKGGLTKSNYLPTYQKIDAHLPKQTYTKVNYLPAAHKLTKYNVLPSAPKKTKKNFLPKPSSPPPEAPLPRNIPVSEQNAVARCSYCEQAVLQVAHVGPAHMWEWCRTQGYEALLCQSVVAVVSHVFASYTKGKYTYKDQFQLAATFAGARPRVCKKMCKGGKTTIYQPVERVNLMKD